MDGARPDWENFFDDLADRWDSVARHDPAMLEELLAPVALGAGDRVLDVGTGTGVLLSRILQAVGASGAVVACDLSSRMLERARRSHAAANVTFVRSAVEDLPPGEPFDAILCYSVLPHFADPWRTLSLLAARLSSGGRLAAFHTQSRAAINGVHQEAGGPVARDLLPPAVQVEAHLGRLGLEIIAVRDDERSWQVVGRRV